MPTHAVPYCHRCSSHDIGTTSAQQQLRVNGKNRLHAEAVCNACKHTWWSRSKAVLAMARKADQARAQTAPPA